MDAIRVLVAEGDTAARRLLLAALENDANVEVVDVCETAAQTDTAMQEVSPDLVFIDVDMAGMSGFDVLNTKEPGFRPEVVFVAESEKDAARAFEVGALDYLVCPLTEPRVSRSLERAKNRIRLSEESPTIDRSDSQHTDSPYPDDGPDGNGHILSNDRYLKRIVVKAGDRIRFVASEEVNWVEARGDRLLLHTGDGDHLIRCTMKELEKRLDPERFLRIHRSTIINVTCLQELQPYFHGEYIVVLTDGTKLRLSRGRRENLERLLGQAI